MKVKRDLKYKYIWTFYDPIYLHRRDSQSRAVAINKKSGLDVLKQDGRVYPSSPQPTGLVRTYCTLLLYVLCHTLLEKLQQFYLLSKLDKIFSLNNHDVENNIMQQPDFKYYTLEDFLNNKDISQSKSMLLFSTIHFNVRRLSANHDGLTMLLLELQHSFDVIGLSETNIKSNCDLTSDIAVEGYDFC